MNIHSTGSLMFASRLVKAVKGIKWSLVSRLVLAVKMLNVYEND